MNTCSDKVPNLEIKCDPRLEMAVSRRFALMVEAWKANVKRIYPDMDVNAAYERIKPFRK